MWPSLASIERWRLRDPGGKYRCPRSRSQPVEMRMNSYEIYRLYGGEMGRHSVQSVDCRDDLEALAAARGQSHEQPVEVWQGQRFVARVKKDDAALDANDHQFL